MADQLYFSGTVDNVSGLFRVNAQDGTARVDLPNGIDDISPISIDGGSPIFIVANDAGGFDLLELLSTGALVRLANDSGAQVTAADADSIAFGDGIVFFREVIAGEDAIWSRAANGVVAKVTDALDGGKLFEFNDDRLWVDAVSDIGAADNVARSAVFAVSQTGEIDRITELRRSETFIDDQNDRRLRTVDAEASSGTVIGSSVVFQHDTTVEDIFGGFRIADVTKALSPDGVERDFPFSDVHAVSGDQIFIAIRDDRGGGDAYGTFNVETGASLGFDGVFRNGESISDAAFFEGIPHIIADGQLFSIAANGARTLLTDPSVDGNPTGPQLGRILDIAAFDDALFLEAEAAGPGGIGFELFKLEQNAFSLVSNLTPGAAGSSIRFIGEFDTGEAGGTPIFSSTGTGAGPGNDILDGTDDDDEISGLGGDDVITGNRGNDVLNGNDGDDRLIGGIGQDTLAGGAGDDFYDLEADDTDILIENVDEGIDTVRGSRPITLLDNFENLEAEGLSGTGNALDNLITGNRFFQTLSGLNGDDRIDGTGGEDVLLGGNGDDTLIGGIGDFRDKLVGGNGNDVIDAGGGNDRAFGNAGDDVIDGGDGDDQIAGQSGSDQIDGGAGNDTIDGGFHDDVIRGGDGDDRLVGNGGFDEIDGGDGDDLIFGGAHADIIRGGDGDDVILGQSLGDDMTGGAGGDEFFITPGAGDDVIRDFEVGFLSSDVVNIARLGFTSSNAVIAAIQDNANGDAVLSYSGGSITFDGFAEADLSIFDFHTKAGGPVGTGLGDTIFGSSRNEKLIGNAGNDEIRAGGGADAISGGTGADLLLGQAGDDLVRGGDGNDRAFGNSGNDRVIGDAGDDVLFGQSGDDLVAGASGDDDLNGGTGLDRLFGNQGNDILDGGDGDDELTGGAGDDQFTGGAGSDRFVAGSGIDVIVDFQSGPGGDILDLSILGFADLDAVLAVTTNNALGALIQISAADSVNILGIPASDLNINNVDV